MSAHIPLTRDMVALVDDPDVGLLLRHKWFAAKPKPTGRTYYACTNLPGGKSTRMHRFLLSAPSFSVVDHINGDGLDNRRCNLRLVTYSENAWNRRSTRPDKYKGVFPHHKRFFARIFFDRKPVYLGLFPTAIEAAVAYDAAARELHGEFAVVNFPEPSENLPQTPGYERLPRIIPTSRERNAVYDHEGYLFGAFCERAGIPTGEPVPHAVYPLACKAFNATGAARDALIAEAREILALRPAQIVAAE